MKQVHHDEKHPEMAAEPTSPGPELEVKGNCSRIMQRERERKREREREREQVQAGRRRRNRERERERERKRERERDIYIYMYTYIYIYSHVHIRVYPHLQRVYLGIHRVMTEYICIYTALITE